MISAWNLAWIIPAVLIYGALLGGVPGDPRPGGRKNKQKGGSGEVKKKKIPDWLDRTWKTAVQAFGCVLIPELVIILQGGWPESWGVLWACLSPVVSSGLAAAICAVWNIILEMLREPKRDEVSGT